VQARAFLILVEEACSEDVFRGLFSLAEYWVANVPLRGQTRALIETSLRGLNQERGDDHEVLRGLTEFLGNVAVAFPLGSRDPGRLYNELWLQGQEPPPPAPFPVVDVGGVNAGAAAAAQPMANDVPQQQLLPGENVQQAQDALLQAGLGSFSDHADSESGDMVVHGDEFSSSNQSRASNDSGGIGDGLGAPPVAVPQHGNVDNGNNNNNDDAPVLPYFPQPPLYQFPVQQENVNDGNNNIDGDDPLLEQLEPLPLNAPAMAVGDDMEGIAQAAAAAAAALNVAPPARRAAIARRVAISRRSRQGQLQDLGPIISSSSGGRRASSPKGSQPPSKRGRKGG
jgi:hypothetical protein